MGVLLSMFSSFPHTWSSAWSKLRAPVYSYLYAAFEVTGRSLRKNIRIWSTEYRIPSAKAFFLTNRAIYAFSIQKTLWKTYCLQSVSLTIHPAGPGILPLKIFFSPKRCTCCPMRSAGCRWLHTGWRYSPRRPWHCRRPVLPQKTLST